MDVQAVLRDVGRAEALDRIADDADRELLGLAPTLAQHCRALMARIAELEAAPAGSYSCGCPARWAARRIDGFCATHYRPLKDVMGGNL